MTNPTCLPLPDGNLQITASGVFDAYDASLLIVEIAKAATQAQKRSGHALPDQNNAVVPYIEPTAMGIDPQQPKEGYILLSLFFGLAQVGIAIAKSDGTQLGQALIAACSDETTAH